MRRVLRRVHLSQCRPGEVALAPGAAHHVRNVLRLNVGATIEVFDGAGATAAAEIIHLEPVVIVRISAVTAASFTADASSHVRGIASRLMSVKAAPDALHSGARRDHPH